MLDKSLKKLPGHAPIRLDNETCVYCGTVLDVSTRTKEHVVGRRFVPKGNLNKQWNLIVWACRSCNGLKSDFENDLSAISMQPDVFRHADDSLVAEASRKAQNAFSRRTGKLVKESQERLTIKVPFGAGAEFTFDLTAPPQADSYRVFDLARLQLIAFFYWVTFNPATRRGAGFGWAASIRYWRRRVPTGGTRCNAHT
jgi:hypothetical protein